jgi:ABC-type transporter Mla subunit MlaD
MAAIANTAGTLDALATQRRALGDSLDRAPAVLGQTSRTLAQAATAITTLRPVLRRVPPTAKPLHGLLVRANRTLPPATSAVTKLRSQLPNLKLTLDGLKPLAPRASRALQSAATALHAATPIVAAFRYYGSDLMLGVFQGLTGVATANYDRWGHYARLEFTQPYQTSLGGLFPNPFAHPLLPGLFNLRSGLDRRCPGGNAPPAPDGSSPWALPASICTAAQDVSPDVNFP